MVVPFVEPEVFPLLVASYETGQNKAPAAPEVKENIETETPAEEKGAPARRRQ